MHDESSIHKKPRITTKAAGQICFFTLLGGLELQDSVIMQY